MWIGTGLIINELLKVISTQSQRHFAIYCNPGIHSDMARSTRYKLLNWLPLLALFTLLSGCRTLRSPTTMLIGGWNINWSNGLIWTRPRRTLQSGLGPYFKWHRSEIMPRIADAVSALTQAAAQGECAKLFDKQQSLWNSLYRETVEKMTPIIAGVLVSLDSDQQVELAEGMQADLKKASERMKNPQREPINSYQDGRFPRRSYGQTRRVLTLARPDWYETRRAANELPGYPPEKTGGRIEGKAIRQGDRNPPERLVDPRGML